MDAIATTWDHIVAGLNGLGTEQLVVVLAAIAAAAFTLARVFTLVEVLVRGHAPAEHDLDELVGVLGRIEDALGERGHLAGCIGDVYGAIDELVDIARATVDAEPDDTFAEEQAADAAHRRRVEELLADLLAATRTTTLAVQALDDEFDPDGEHDPAVSYAQLAAYTYEPKMWPAPARGVTPDVVITDDLTLAGADGGIRSTRLHELTETIVAEDRARGLVTEIPTDDDYRLAGSDDGIRGDTGPMLTTWHADGHEHRPYVADRSHRHAPDQPEHEHDADGWSTLGERDEELDQ